ncbi:ankyrin repeat domain-containing protein [Candidatus Dependentiae bacterium]|nr:ankyrin repeat domain-containing protein [Candidatus Dependentiae bacterium]
MKKIIFAVIIFSVISTSNVKCMGSLTDETISKILNLVTINKNISFRDNLDNILETRELLISGIRKKYKSDIINKIEINIDNKLSKLLADNYDKKTLNEYFIKAPHLFSGKATPVLIIAKLLFRAGADLEARDDQGLTSLLMASQYGNVDILKFLIQVGADIQAKDLDGYTALMFAIFAPPSDRDEAIKLLVDKGVNINAKNKDGNTALMLASEGCFINIVKLLITSGADINIKNNKNDTALSLVEDSIANSTERRASICKEILDLLKEEKIKQQQKTIR